MSRLEEANKTILFSACWSEGELRVLPSAQLEAMAGAGDGYFLSARGETRRLELPDKELWRSEGSFEHFCGPLPGSGDFIAIREQGLFLLEGATGAARPLCEALPELTPTRAPASPTRAAVSADGGYLAIAGHRELAAWSLRTGAGRVFPVRQPIYGLAFSGSTLLIVGNRYRVVAVDVADASADRLEYKTIEGWDYKTWGAVW